MGSETIAALSKLIRNASSAARKRVGYAANGLKAELFKAGEGAKQLRAAAPALVAKVHESINTIDEDTKAKLDQTVGCDTSEMKERFYKVGERTKQLRATGSDLVAKVHESINVIDDDTKAKLGHIVGYSANGFKKGLVKAGEGVRQLRVAGPALVAKLHEGMHAIDDDTKAKLGQVVGYASNGLKVGLFKAGEGARYLGDAGPALVAKVHESINVIDDNTKAKLGQIVGYSANGLKEGLFKAGEGVRQLQAAGPALVAKLHEGIHAIDDDTKAKLGQVVGYASNGLKVGLFKAGEGARYLGDAGPALVAKIHESINVIDDDTKTKLGQIVGYAANEMKEGLFRAGEGARQLGEAIPDQVVYVFTKVHEGICAMDDDTKAQLVVAAKATGGAVLFTGGATMALPALGFCVGGVKAGSLAAVAHSMIGNVTAGSTFALLQSAGVLGLSITTKAALGAIGAVVVSTPRPWQLGPSLLRLWQPGIIGGLSGQPGGIAGSPGPWQPVVVGGLPGQWQSAGFGNVATSPVFAGTGACEMEEKAVASLAAAIAAAMSDLL